MKAASPAADASMAQAHTRLRHTTSTLGVPRRSRMTILDLLPIREEIIAGSRASARDGGHGNARR